MLKGNRGKSTARKPLVDISNGGKPSRHSKKKAPPDGGDGDAALDRLLLVRSDLSSLVGEIDDLVAQALENKRIDRKGSQDIESFGNVLSDMHSSLKSWVSRLRKAFDGMLVAAKNQPSQTVGTNYVSYVNEEENAFPNKNETELDLIVSPSPLVSWRAGSCTLETGKQLFLLTPLPKAKVLSSKCSVGPSKSIVRILHDKNQHDTLELPSTLTLSKSVCDDLFEKLGTRVPRGNVAKTCTTREKNSKADSTFVSPWKFKNNKDPMFLLTPCLKTSTPKSSAVDYLASENILEPQGYVTEPCTAGERNGMSESNSVSPLKCKSNKDTAFSLTPLLKTSSLKSSALHDLISENIPEPPTQDNDSKGSDNLTSDNILEGLTSRYQELLGLQPSNNVTNRRKEINQTLDWFLSPPKTCVLMEPTEDKPEPTPVHNGMLMLATPLWKGVESTVHKGKRAGESTLKKELWTRFEEVSRDGLHFDSSVFQKTGRKGFLDMLEEACETSDADLEMGNNSSS